MVGVSTDFYDGIDLLLGLFSNLIVDLFVAKTIRFTNQQPVIYTQNVC